MSQQARLRATVLLGILLSIPAVQTAQDGAIDYGTMAIRVGIAMVVAYVAVWVVASVIDAYQPKQGPPVEEDATGEEVELETAEDAEPGAETGA